MFQRRSPVEASRYFEPAIKGRVIGRDLRMHRAVNYLSVYDGGGNVGVRSLITRAGLHYEVSLMAGSERALELTRRRVTSC